MANEPQLGSDLICAVKPDPDSHGNLVPCKLTADDSFSPPRLIIELPDRALRDLGIATVDGTVSIAAGTAVIGKVSIDQTTPGTTNAVAVTNLPTTVDTNSGVKSASTLRVVLATDQPALTNKLLVTPDSVALPANQSCNTAQINGVTPLMGAGNTGTGSPRVTISTDQVALAGLGVYVEDAAETAGGNLVMSGAVRRDTPTSSSGTTGDNSTINTNENGGLWITEVAAAKGGNSVATGSIGATKTDIGTANTAGKVTGWYFYNPNSSVAYAQFFNTQASGVTLGTTAPAYSLGIPATSAANVEVSIDHSTAISIAITTTRAGATGPGSTVDYNIWYKQ